MTVETIELPPTSGRTLNRTHDRCDRCGAQAFTVYERPSVDASGNIGSQDFLFCGHHGARYHAGLEAAGFTKTSDETASINAKPSPSANAD